MVKQAPRCLFNPSAATRTGGSGTVKERFALLTPRWCKGAAFAPGTGKHYVQRIPRWCKQLHKFICKMHLFTNKLEDN